MRIPYIIMSNPFWNCFGRRLTTASTRIPERRRIQIGILKKVDPTRQYRHNSSPHMIEVPNRYRRTTLVNMRTVKIARKIAITTSSNFSSKNFQKDISTSLLSSKKKSNCLLPDTYSTVFGFIWWNGIIRCVFSQFAKRSKTKNKNYKLLLIFQIMNSSYSIYVSSFRNIRSLKFWFHRNGMTSDFWNVLNSYYEIFNHFTKMVFEFCGLCQLITE